MLGSFKIREKHLEQKNKLWKRLVMSNRYANMMTVNSVACHQTGQCPGAHPTAPRQACLHPHQLVFRRCTSCQVNQILLISFDSFQSTWVPLDPSYFFLNLPCCRGVEGIWDTRDSSDGWFNLGIFYTSTVFSFAGFYLGLTSNHMFSKHNIVPDLGKILLLLLYLVACTSRILALLLLATPCLGLFGLMRPYVKVSQGSSTCTPLPQALETGYANTTDWTGLGKSQENWHLLVLDMEDHTW